MSTREEMLVIKRGYDLSKWLLDHTGKFPKSYRFSVAAKIENAILEFLEMTTVANMRQDKLPLSPSEPAGTGRKLDRARSAGRYGGAPRIAPPSFV